MVSFDRKEDDGSHPEIRATVDLCLRWFPITLFSKVSPRLLRCNCSRIDETFMVISISGHAPGRRVERTLAQAVGLAGACYLDPVALNVLQLDVV